MFSFFVILAVREVGKKVAVGMSEKMDEVRVHRQTHRQTHTDTDRTQIGTHR